MMQTLSGTENYGFHELFPNKGATQFPYTKARIKDISTHRALLEQSLFIDLLLKDVIGLDNSISYYPPHDMNALQSLYVEICKANTDSVKKASFVYYLLKDWSRKEAETFAAKSMIPQTFAILIDAFYALDNLNIVESLPYLTLPSLELNYTPKISSTLLKHSPEGAGPRNAINFIEISNIPTTEDAISELYFTALLQTSIESAFLYQRTLSKSRRTSLFNSLVEYCLVEHRDQSMFTLLKLPLDDEEKHELDSFLLKCDMEMKQDFVVLMDMSAGKLDKVLDVTRSAKPSSSEYQDWSILTSGLSSAIGNRKTALSS